MKKKTIRMIIDTIMTTLMVFEMFIQFTGIALHEAAGLALFVTLVIHLALSAKWIGSSARALGNGKVTAKLGSKMLMAVLLGIDALVLGISSIAISQTLNVTSAFLTLADYNFWFVLHAVSSRVLCALTVIHLAMHWVFIAAQLKVPYIPERRQAINVGVGAISALGAAYLGFTAIQAATGNAFVAGATDEPEAQATETDDSLAEEPIVEEPVVEEPVAEGPVAEEEPVVEEPVVEETPAEQPVLQPEQQAGEQTEEDEEEEEELVYCPLCHNHCLLVQHRCQRPVMAGLIDA